MGVVDGRVRKMARTVMGCVVIHNDCFSGVTVFELLRKSCSMGGCMLILYFRKRNKFPYRIVVEKCMVMAILLLYFLGYQSYFYDIQLEAYHSYNSPELKRIWWLEVTV